VYLLIKRQFISTLQTHLITRVQRLLIIRIHHPLPLEGEVVPKIPLTNPPSPVGHKVILIPVVLGLLPLPVQVARVFRTQFVTVD
jgi:hypothetical protein